MQLQCSPEYLDFFGSLLTTAMVNCAKWLQPGRNSSFQSQSQPWKPNTFVRCTGLRVIPMSINVPWNEISLFGSSTMMHIQYSGGNCCCACLKEASHARDPGCNDSDVDHLQPGRNPKQCTSCQLRKLDAPLDASSMHQCTRISNRSYSHCGNMSVQHSHRLAHGQHQLTTRALLPSKTPQSMHQCGLVCTDQGQMPLCKPLLRRNHILWYMSIPLLQGAFSKSA